MRADGYQIRSRWENSPKRFALRQGGPLADLAPANFNFLHILECLDGEPGNRCSPVVPRLAFFSQCAAYWSSTTKRTSGWC
jgi:hypothetical protein